MKTSSLKIVRVLFPLLALGLLACQPPEPTDPTVGAAVARGEGRVPGTSQRKPSAPVTVDYEVIGTPSVGRPMEIQLSFSSSQADPPVYASYRVPEPAALSFVELPWDKMPVDMRRANGGSSGVQRLRLTPHREGRIYLNVVTEIETEMGSLSKSTSIPIDVSGPGEQIKSNQDRELPEPGVEVEVDSAGEAIISLPAEQNGD